MQACPSLGAWHGYNWDHPTRYIAIPHDPVIPCDCTTVKRVRCPLRERGVRDINFGRFCRALGFDPRMPVYEILDFNSKEKCHHLAGNLRLVELHDPSQDFILYDEPGYIEPHELDYERENAFQARKPLFDHQSPYEWVDRCGIVMEMELKGCLNPPVAFIQSRVRFEDTPAAVEFVARTQRRAEEKKEKEQEKRQRRHNHAW